MTNSGASATSISARVSSSDPNTTVVDSDVLFGDVAANSTATSLNTFSVQLPTNSTLNPSVLNWQTSAPSAPISFTLTDSGAYDAATGDGIYTGTFTPSVKGDYTVYITASGTSSSGAAFSRTAMTSFQVSDSLARIGALSDAPVYNSNGLVDHVAITAPVNVQAAGTYRLTLDLQASNGKSTQASISTPLSAGNQQMVLNFPFASLLSLGTDGPYTEAHARLVLVSNSDSTLADYIDNAGSTQAYTQSSVSPGPLAFTGQNTAAGVITGAGPTFDLLRVTIGVYSASSGSCSWSGMLTDLGGNQITYSYSTGSVTTGNNSITLDFNGNQIAAAVNGPYLVKYVGVYCGSAQVTASTLFQTQSFSASQFTFVPADFTLAVQSSPASALPGSTFQYRFYITTAGVLPAPVHLSVGGLPTGATASFSVPDVKGFGPSYLNVMTSASTPSGAYPLTILGASGTLSHTVGAMLTVQGSTANSSCQVTYANTNDWGTGFTGSISVTNSGSSTINGWTLTWTWPGTQQMTQAWGSNYAQNGSAVTLINADFNASIGPGATISGIGFNANYSGTNVPPSNFYLNGSLCANVGAPVPVAPTNLSANAVSAGQINLAWTASTTAGVTYNVYANASPSFTAANLVAGNLSATSFQHQSLTPSQTYYYVVTAVNAAGESPYSNQATATTPAAGGSSCQVSYTNTNDWGTGFTGGLSITNTSNIAIQGWTLTWTWAGDQQITSAWNANSAQNGSNVTLSSLSSDNNMAPGATLTGVGFNANYSGTNTPPTAFYLNGALCQ